MKMQVQQRKMKMRYKIMYVRKMKDDRQASVMDFKKGRLITFRMAEFDLLEEDLQEYVNNIKEDIMTGRWDYTGPHT